jgi:hypothetical protein
MDENIVSHLRLGDTGQADLFDHSRETYAGTTEQWIITLDIEHFTWNGEAHGLVISVTIRSDADARNGEKARCRAH